jgi:trk system potassium uptake protein TrkH
MAEGAGALTYAVRPRVVGRYLCQLSLMLGILALVPLAVSVALGEYAFSVRYFVVIGSLLAAALAGRRLPAPDTIQANEAIVVVSLTFVLAPLLMTFPLAASSLPLEDALFEAVSAITTTGLSTIGSIEGRAPVFLFARSWMQWYGGLGIAVLSVALIMGHHTAARRLAEPTATTNIATTARTQAREALRVYVLLTLIGVLALWAALGDGFSALIHMLSTLSTGGFSPLDRSIAAIPRAGAWIVTAFSVLGAVPLLLYATALDGRPGALVRDPEVRGLLVVVALAAVLLTLSLHANSGLSWNDAFEHGVMLGVSAQTTTGFSSIPVSELDSASKLLMTASMIIGGGSGSTAGGIKLLRLLLILRLLQFFVQRTAMPPHAVAKPRLASRPIEHTDVERATLVIILFFATTGLSWLVFVAYGYAPLDALFEVTSAVGTVGLSTGITAMGLETPLKLLLCADMLLGRLEVLALVVLLYPRTWIGKRT